jgi:hypothetical protein
LGLFYLLIGVVELPPSFRFIGIIGKCVYLALGFGFGLAGLRNVR